jgi:predicted RNA-binding protein
MTNPTHERYWIIVASRDHVQRGVSGGFAQANHGKSSPLRRMKPSDQVIYYSSKMVFGQEEKCQRFTAIGEVLARDVYAATMGDQRVVNRRDIAYTPCNEAPILPLIDRLSFIPNKCHWGAPFRFGMLEIPQADFELIESRMTFGPNPRATAPASSPVLDMQSI